MTSIVERLNKLKAKPLVIDALAVVNPHLTAQQMKDQGEGVFLVQGNWDGRWRYWKAHGLGTTTSPRLAERYTYKRLIDIGFNGNYIRFIRIE